MRYSFRTRAGQERQKTKADAITCSSSDWQRGTELTAASSKVDVRAVEPFSHANWSLAHGPVGREGAKG